MSVGKKIKRKTNRGKVLPRTEQDDRFVSSLTKKNGRSCRCQEKPISTNTQYQMAVKDINDISANEDGKFFRCTIRWGGDSNSETTSESEDETEDESTEDSAENDDTSLSS